MTTEDTSTTIDWICPERVLAAVTNVTRTTDPHKLGRHNRASTRVRHAAWLLLRKYSGLSYEDIGVLSGVGWTTIHNGVLAETARMGPPVLDPILASIVQQCERAIYPSEAIQ